MIELEDRGEMSALGSDYIVKVEVDVVYVE